MTRYRIPQLEETLALQLEDAQIIRLSRSRYSVFGDLSELRRSVPAFPAFLRWRTPQSVVVLDGSPQREWIERPVSWSVVEEALGILASSPAVLCSWAGDAMLEVGSVVAVERNRWTGIVSEDLWILLWRRLWSSLREYDRRADRIRLVASLFRLFRVYVEHGDSLLDRCVVLVERLLPLVDSGPPREMSGEEIAEATASASAPGQPGSDSTGSGGVRGRCRTTSLRIWYSAARGGWCLRLGKTGQVAVFEDQLDAILAVETLAAGRIETRSASLLGWLRRRLGRRVIR